MNRRWVLVVIGALAVAGLGFIVLQRVIAPRVTNRIALAGDVQTDLYTVQAPPITYPVPDYTVGIPTAQTAGAASAKKPTGSPSSPAMGPQVSGFITSMYVQQGDPVRAGQPIVQYDTTRLELGVDAAKAAARRARAQVAVLGKSLDTIETNQDKLATGRAQLATGRAALAKAAAQLAKAEAQFPAQKKAALAKRTQLVLARAALEAQLAQLQQSPNPDPKAIAALKAQIAQLSAGIKGIDKGLASAAAAFAKGNAQIAQGKAKLATASSQLAQGASALAKAKSHLKNARKVLDLSTAIQDAGVSLAKVQLARATILAPVSGIVTQARDAGTVAMVGAPLVRIQAAGPTKVVSYLDPSQLTRVKLGSSATVNYDSNDKGPLRGHVTLFSPAAQFPPTSFPTSIVHMTETVRITVTLDKGAWAPPGTPVDLVVDTSNGS